MKTGIYTPRAPVVFGAADGLTIMLGLLAGMAVSHQPPLSIWHAALSGGLAELAGMSLGQYWSAKEDGIWAAAACGIAACLAAVTPAIPYAVLGGNTALALSILLVMAAGAIIAWLRAEVGWQAVLQTYGLLLAAAVLCGAAGVLG